jgi:hypothetical protein
LRASPLVSSSAISCSRPRHARQGGTGARGLHRAVADARVVVIQEGADRRLHVGVAADVTVHARLLAERDRRADPLAKDRRARELQQVLDREVGRDMRDRPRGLAAALDRRAVEVG